MPPEERRPPHLIIIRRIERAYQEAVAKADFDQSVALRVHIASWQKIETLCGTLQEMEMSREALTETIDKLRKLTDTYHDSSFNSTIIATALRLTKKAYPMATK